MELALIVPVVTDGFKSTGLYPLNPNAIDKSKLIGDPITFCPTQDNTISLIMECNDGTQGTKTKFQSCTGYYQGTTHYVCLD
jgi:hypothetical protein